MAYHYAFHVERVATVGRKTYDLPLVTDNWLRNIGQNSVSSDGVDSGGSKPGEYPFGGPVRTVLDVRWWFTPSRWFGY